MDAAQALRELMELSSQVEGAVVLDAEGAVLGSTFEDSAASSSLAGSALELLGAASELGPQPQDATRVEIELEDGAVFVLREGGLAIAATTGPEPTSGLVVYDLRTCLRGIGEPKPKKRRSPRTAEEASE